MVMPWSERHCFEAVAITMSAADLSKIWGWKMSTASATPSNMASWSSHCSSVWASRAPVSPATALMWTRKRGSDSASRSTRSRTSATSASEETTAPFHAESGSSRKYPRSEAVCSTARARSPWSRAISYRVSSSRRTRVEGASSSSVRSVRTRRAWAALTPKFL